MVIFDKDDKKSIYQFLNPRLDKIIDFLKYPDQFWDVSLPDQLKDQLKELQEKYSNINEQAEEFIINRIRSNFLEVDKVFYAEKENFWKGYTYLDLMADYLYFQENEEQFSNSHSVYDTIKRSVLRAIREKLQSYRLDSVSEEDEFSLFNYQSIKPGKFIKKLFPEATPQECESFQQKWFSYFRKWNVDALVLSDKIIRNYHGRNYADRERGPLASSCMRYDGTLLFMHFYEMNGVKIVTFPDPDDETKIRARALVWENVFIPDEKEREEHNLPKYINFVDRIYFNTEKDKMFIEAWAVKNGYYRKAEPSPDWVGVITPEGRRIDNRFKMNYPITYVSGYFPYIDTLFLIESTEQGELVLTNKQSSSLTPTITLRDTSGGYSGSFSVFSREIRQNKYKIFIPHSNRWVDRENATVCRSCYTVHELAVCPVCGN